MSSFSEAELEFRNSSKSFDSNGRDRLPYLLFPFTYFGDTSSFKSLKGSAN